MKRRRQKTKNEEIAIGCVGHAGDDGTNQGTVEYSKTWYIYIASEGLCEIAALAARKVSVMASPSSAIQYLRAVGNYRGQRIERDDGSTEGVVIEAGKRLRPLLLHKRADLRDDLSPIRAIGLAWNRRGRKRLVRDDIEDT